MKLLEDIALFSKFIGLKKETVNMGVNATVFKTFFKDEESGRKVRELDDQILELLEKLDELVDSHRKLFLEHVGPLVEDGEPNEEFLKLYLLVAYIGQGDIKGCLGYANDLMSIVRPEMTDEARVDLITEFAKQVVMEGYLSASITVLTSEGPQQLTDENAETLEGEMGQIKLVLTQKGTDMISEELSELEQKKRGSITLKPSTILDLMSMPSPSKVLN